MIGLPDVPLDRLDEGVRNLKVLAMELSGRRRQFAMVRYIIKHWIKGPIKRKLGTYMIMKVKIIK